MRLFQVVFWKDSCTLLPLNKLIKVYNKNKKLYERLLEAKKEKITNLKKLLKKQITFYKRYINSKKEALHESLSCFRILFILLHNNYQKLTQWIKL